MTTIDKIRAEIMRMHQEAVGLAIGNQTDWLRSRVATCVDLLSFLDTLEEEFSMKAPDKIYLGIQDLGSGYVYDLSLDNNGEQEYIRKDAFLEWAKEHYTGLDITKRDMWDGGYNCAMKELIDKLNSL